MFSFPVFYLLIYFIGGGLIIKKTAFMRHSFFSIYPQPTQISWYLFHVQQKLKTLLEEKCEEEKNEKGRFQPATG